MDIFDIVTNPFSPQSPIERWHASVDGRVCAGCRYLEDRVFFAGQGPRPPLHPGCRCVRRGVDTAGIHGAALISLVLTASRNGANAEALLLEATRRRRDEFAQHHGPERDTGQALRALRRASRRQQRRNVRRVVTGKEFR